MLRNNGPRELFCGPDTSYTSKGKKIGKSDYYPQQNTCKLIQHKPIPAEVLRGYTQLTWMHLVPALNPKESEALPLTHATLAQLKFVECNRGA